MHSSPLTFNIELLTSIFNFRGWPWHAARRDGAADVSNLVTMQNEM
jgi:hypothetical protein